ncbi:Adenomatous Polyposis Coli Protein [Manis pentadactyla]|nr:Adenomatous Polyposis Coli Protein [Manis pentadactyla]
MHTIRLRKEYGFNSDGQCAIQFHDYSEARVIYMLMVEFQATGNSMHTIRLRREFGFNSDVITWMSLRLRLKMCLLVGSNFEGVVSSPGLGTRGECAIQFQDYSEAIVVSMVILEFQATGPR